MWFEQQVPVIFGCFVKGVSVCLSVFVCVFLRRGMHKPVQLCVLMCVLPCCLCIFRRTEIHSRKLRQAEANKALRFAKLHTPGMLSICLPTLSKVLYLQKIYILSSHWFKQWYKSKGEKKKNRLQRFALKQPPHNLTFQFFRSAVKLSYSRRVELIQNVNVG